MVNRLLKRVSPIAWSALLMTLSGCSLETGEEGLLEAEARVITQQYVSKLLPTLQQAMAEGGPVNAVEVCSVRALAIAEELEKETDWSIRRVSLKARNRQHATPDAWEREVLAEFDLKRSSGAAAAELSKAATEGGEFRFMQGQITQPLCLTCHGADLSSDVRTALGRFYPNDLATGYEVGDVRGAISLRFNLD